MSFTQQELGYDYDACEPNIDARTMEIHYSKHHAAYVSKLNAAVEGTDHANETIENLLQNIDSVDSSKRQAVINNGGGHANHSLFWKLLTPGASTGNPSGELLDAINSTFGSFDAFKEQFSNAAATRFGSGWAWLVLNEDNTLAVTSTANQDSPLMTNQRPIIGLDVWEHAYYLKYQNKRPDYVGAFWSALNWDQANEIYKTVKNGQAVVA